MSTSASPKPPAPSEKMIFISHAGADKPRLGPYLEHLLERTSNLADTVFLWIDHPGEVGWPPPGPAVGRLANHPRIRSLPSGAAWNAAIAEAVARSDCVFVVYSDKAEPEKSLVFASEILAAFQEKKWITISLDPIRKREKPDILLHFIQWTDVSRFTSAAGDGGAFDRVIDQAINMLYPKTVQGPAQSTESENAPASIAELRAMADTQRSREMSLLSNADGAEPKIVDRKYIESVFVERRELAASLQRFITSSDAQTFIILGDAGMGKTSVLCAAANELGCSGCVLFYLAVELHGGLKAALQMDLEQFIGQRALGAGLSLLAKEVIRAGEPLSIFIDGLNEAPGDRKRLRSELNELVRETEGSGIHWVITCRTLDWDYWLRNDNNMIGRFGRSIYSEHGDGTASSVVVEFDGSELDLAWEKYKTEFGLVGTLSPQLRALCREPFMLRLVAEIYRGGKTIPTDVDAMQLFDRYFSERFPDNKQLLAVNKVLMTAAKRTLEDGTAYIEVANLGSDEFAVCERLMQENVLVCRSDTHLHFHFELVLEYLLSKWIVGTVPTDASKEEKFAKVIAASRSPSLNVLGAVENILLLWQADESTVVEILGQLIRRDNDHWKTMACSVLRKMAKLPHGAGDIVEVLAGDSNFVVRRYLAQAISLHGVDAQPIVSELMLDRMVWERRETAANVLRWIPEATPTNARSQLIGLADDAHWRVRRAAGYAMQERWSAEPSERTLAIADLQKFSWRQRHSICIGLIGCSAIGETPEGDAIAALGQDDNHQVRWMVANYLTRFVDAEKSGMVERLAGDPDPWVRGHTASALISMDQAKRSSSGVAEALQALARDSAIGVRIRVARDLEKVSSEPWAQKLLYEYLTDAPEVSFAAAYTLGGVPLGNAANLIGDDALVDMEARLWIMRERIARGEVDPRTSRFGPLQDAISQAVELPAESDRYMRIIDSMSSLIAAAADRLALASSEQRRFFEVLCEDMDESVRWALVLYLASFAGAIVHVDQKLEILTRLALDPHFWVRREVALALGRWGDRTEKDERIALLTRMWANELASNEACKDEVLHYLRDALRSLGVGTA